MKSPAWSRLTFLLPGDDLGVRAGKQEVELQGNVGDQVLQDGRLLAGETGKAIKGGMMEG